MATKRNASLARMNTNGPDPTEAEVQIVENRIAEGNAAEVLRRAGIPVVDLTVGQEDSVDGTERRFEAFKLDLYRMLCKHKYVLTTTGVMDVAALSRIKRQMAIGGSVERLEKPQ